MFPTEMPDTCTQVWTLTHWFKNQSFVLQASQPVKNDAKRAHFQTLLYRRYFPQKMETDFCQEFFRKYQELNFQYSNQLMLWVFTVNWLAN